VAGTNPRLRLEGSNPAPSHHVRRADADHGLPARPGPRPDGLYAAGAGIPAKSGSFDPGVAGIRGYGRGFPGASCGISAGWAVAHVENRAGCALDRGARPASSGRAASLGLRLRGTPATYAATYTLVSVCCSGWSSLQATNGFVEPNCTSSQAASTSGSGLLIRSVIEARRIPIIWLEHIRRHADQLELAAALAQQLVPGRERDQVREPSDATESPSRTRSTTASRSGTMAATESLSRPGPARVRAPARSRS
jgi:hypothetical protein